MPSTYSLDDVEVSVKPTNGEVQVVQRTGGTVVKAASGDTTDQHDDKGAGEGGGEDEKFGLKRTLGVFGAISFNLGTMIGSGIFVSPKGVLENAGSVGLSLVMWTFTGVIAMLGGLCFAELGTLIGKSAGEFVYLQQAYGGALAYMFQFVTIFVIKPSSMAITSMTCAEYALALFFEDGCGGAPKLIVKLTAIAIVWIIVFINISSVDASKSVQLIFTVAKILALLIIILGGFVKLGQGSTQYLQNSFEGSNWTFTSIILSFFSAYYAYNGWQLVNAIAEEVKNPKRNIPISVLAAVLAAMFLYVMTNVSYFTVLSPEELLASDTVAIAWAQYVMPNFVWIMPIAVAMSTFGGVNGNTFVLGRYIYRSSREGHLPNIFSFVHVFRMTPVPALVLEAIVATIYILPADIQTLLDMLGFIMWTINGLVFVALIIFRKTKPDSDPRYKRAFKCPLIIAILMAILSVFFVITPIVLDPQFYYFFGLIIFIGCLVFYFPFVYFQLSIPGMDGFTRTCQLFTQSAPSQINVE